MCTCAQTEGYKVTCVCVHARTEGYELVCVRVHRQRVMRSCVCVRETERQGQTEREVGGEGGGAECRCSAMERREQTRCW